MPDLGFLNNAVGIVASLLAIVGFMISVMRYVSKKRKEEHKEPIKPQSQPIGDIDKEFNVNTFDQARDLLIRLNKANKYDEVVSAAELMQKNVFNLVNSSDPEFTLILSEFDVEYARALIYTGKIQKAISVLDKVTLVLETNINIKSLSGKKLRFNKVLGKAYNHKGYLTWMEYGHYEDALVLFNHALLYLTNDGNSGLEEEQANVYDNMGRVYALVGNRERAELLIQKGLDTRIGLGDNYRTALSLNSLAIVNLMFGNYHRGYELSDEAYQLFLKVLEDEKKQDKQLTGNRGVGLALITRGWALRLQGGAWRGLRNDPSQIQRSIDYLKRAIDDLQFALSVFNNQIGHELFDKNIFSTNCVEEPIRNFEALNQLGCAYRELGYLLNKSRKDDESSLEKAQTFLEESIKASNGHSITLYIDAVEDLARLLYYIGDHKNAKEKINELLIEIKNSCPDHLMLDKKDFQTIKSAYCFEEIWKQLGKINILLGEITFSDYASLQSLNLLQEAILRFFDACLYYQQFAIRPLENTNIELYSPGFIDQFQRTLFIAQFLDALNNLTIEQAKTAKNEIFNLRKKHGVDNIHHWSSSLVDAVNVLLLYKGQLIIGAANN